jgi:TolB protein
VSSTRTLRDPSFSPDGKRIAYGKTVGTEIAENPEIFVKNLADGTNKRLTTSAGDDFNPTWSPDGLKLAFVSRRSGRYQIWTMNASTGGSLLRLSDMSGDDWQPKWTH